MARIVARVRKDRQSRGSRVKVEGDKDKANIKVKGKRAEK